jgi:hypothetical protein
MQNGRLLASLSMEPLSGSLTAELAAHAAAVPPLTPDGHFPLCLSRDYEERLYQLVRSGTLAAEFWRASGPAFFMAGLAVLIAGSRGYDRQGLLKLGEQLHPGIGDVPVFNLWLQRTPIQPSRFFSQLEEGQRSVA